MDNKSNKQHIENILQSFYIEPKPLDKLVDFYYKKNRQIGSRDRRYISEIVFDIIRWKTRIEGIVKISEKPLSLKNQIEAYFNFKNNELDFEISGNKFPGGISAFWSAPEFVYKILKKWKGEKFALEIIKSFNNKPDVVLRVNTNKVGRDDLVRLLEKEGIQNKYAQYSALGIILKQRTNFNNLDTFNDGYFEVQDEASQLIGYVVNPNQDETILDMCAGAGGKTLLLSCLIKNKGKIVVSDIDDKKLSILKIRVKKAGAKNIKIITHDKLEKDKEKFDVVLLDAPCTGTGTFRRSVDLKWRITEDILEKRVKVQKELLQKARSKLKENGRIVYVTCSVLPTENEEVVEWFINKYNFQVINSKSFLNIPDSDQFITEKGYFRIDPLKVNMDIFFACVISKNK